MIPSRRSFLLGAGSLLAAPSIVRVASLMSVSVLNGQTLSPEYIRPDYTLSWEVTLFRSEMTRDELLALVDAFNRYTPSQQA